VSGPRVLLAEADVLTRTGVRVSLVEAGFEIAGEVADNAAAIAAAAATGPELVLVSAELPGGALGAVRSIVAARPATRLVILTHHPSGDELLDAVLAGASGYLGSDVDERRLPHALRGVLAGEVALPRRHTERLLDELRRRRRQDAVLAERASTPLTDREWEVLQLLAADASSSQIAGRLGISEVTVRRHVSAAVAKLGVPDRAAAARLVASRSGG
jgi:DNA-binding NarL/FixJ family response regulator